MKYLRPARVPSLRSAGRRVNRRWGRRRAGTRGVSEVVATIILLAMTVVLFSSIFAWVTSFPTPAPQNVTQFSANFVLTTGGSAVQGIQITHLAGPAVSGNTLVYLKSAYHPGAPEFATPITASAYLPNPVTWNLGQTFNYSFPITEQPALPDNITILLVSSDQLVYSTILPGTPIAVPPTFVTTGVSPANPGVGASFTVTAVVTGNTGGNSVYVYLANLPGLGSIYPAPRIMTYNASANQWKFTVPAGETNSNGTYYAFVNVTSGTGQSATAGIAITLASSGSGTPPGSGLSLAVVMNPSPPVLPTRSTTVGAVVTYLGGGQNLALTVNFWINQSAAPHPTQSFSLAGAVGLLISGPVTETIYSQTPATFSGWLLNAVVTVQASATVSGPVSAAGGISFNTADLVTAQPSWSTSPAAPNHTCTGTNCPYLTAIVTNGWLASMVPAGTSIWVRGIMFANASGSFSSAIPNTNVGAGKILSIHTSGMWMPASAGMFTITLYLVVSLSSGGSAIGYIWAGTSVTAV